MVTKRNRRVYLMARDMRVAFKLSEEKKKELDEFAKSYGVTVSALCALIVGEWLHRQRIVLPMMQEMMEIAKEVVRKEAGELVKGEGAV